VKLSVRDATLSEVVRQLAGQLKISILVNDLPKRTEATMEVEGEAAVVLDRVADAFDYIWQEKGKAILLRKRFRDPEEYPTLSRKEVYRATRNIVDILRHVLGDLEKVERSRYLADFYSVLLPQQQQVLVQGKTLAGTQLSRLQLNVLQRAIYCFYLDGPAVEWLRLYDILSDWERTRLEMREYPKYYLNQPGSTFTPPNDRQEWEFHFAYTRHTYPQSLLLFSLPLEAGKLPKEKLK
jgi:hypothetical protein